MSGGGGRERGDRGSKAGSVLTAESRTWAQTHEPRDHALNRSQTLNQLSHPGAPVSHTLKVNGHPSPCHVASNQAPCNQHVGLTLTFCELGLPLDLFLWLYSQFVTQLSLSSNLVPL